ncbi:MAG: hypothetical protein ACE15F_18390 [bacterium]
MEYQQTALIEFLEEFIQGFYRCLLSRGLKSSTAGKHAANAHLFLIEYHAYYFLEGPEKIQPEKIHDFLGIWYFQKVPSPTQTEILSLLTSLKQLAGYLAQRGILPYDRCLQIKQVCVNKLYFLHRLKEFQHHPQLCALTASPRENSRNGFIDITTSLRDILDDDLFWKILTSAHHAASLQDLLNRLHDRLLPLQPGRNVISLEPYLSPPLPDYAVQPPLRGTPPVNRKSLRDHCLALHRSNHVFLRWLDRYQCKLSDLPAEAAAAYLDCDSLLVCMLTPLETHTLSTADIHLGHQILDLMDQVIWSIRYKISNRLGLDLRSLPL